MKFLVASVGNRLESFVAKRFEHAAWYLIVDSESLTCRAFRHNTPHDRHDVLHKASSDNVAAVVAGKFGESSLKMLRTGSLQIAFVHGISARQAIEKIVQREIEQLDVNEMRNGRNTPTTIERLIPKMKAGRIPLASAARASDSPRGHHHLQQYGGRGH